MTFDIVCNKVNDPGNVNLIFISRLFKYYFICISYIHSVLIWLFDINKIEPQPKQADACKHLYSRCLSSNTLCHRE